MRSLLLCVIFAASAASGELPTGWGVEGQATQRDGVVEATGAATLTAPVAAGRRLVLSVRLGKLDVPMRLSASGAGKRVAELSLTAKTLRKSPWPWKKETVADAGIEVWLRERGKPWLFRDQYWIRPNPHFYHKDDLKRALDGWDTLAAASQWPLQVRIEVGGDSTAFWLDDRFIGRVGFAAEKVGVALKAGHAMVGTSVGAVAAHGRFVPIRLAAYRRAGEVGATKSTVAAGQRTFGKVPFEVEAPSGSIDVGISRWLMEAVGPDGFTDDYYTRSAFDGTPESVILAVPTDDYSHAHLLCAVDPDAAKTPVVTLRLTRLLQDHYDSGGRGDGFADTEVRLEKRDGRWPPWCRPVGTVGLATAAGVRRVPLLHVQARLKSGAVEDVLDEQGTVVRRSAQSLDLELTREVHQVTASNYANHSTKPLGRPSGVRVFALTLERSPVRMRVGSAHVGNVFYASERVELDVTLDNVSGGGFEGELSCDTTDFYGTKRTTRRLVTLGRGQTARFAVDVRQSGLGWFQAVVRLTCRGRLLWETPTTFAILPPRPGRAGAESPFGVWWFRRGHLGCDPVETVAPLLQRAGIRHVCPRRQGPSGAELAKHGLSISMLPNFARRPEKAEAAIDKMVKEHPDVKWALIFHETSFGEKVTYPPEFIGEKLPKLNEKQEAKFKQCWDTAIAVSKIYRRKYPDIKLIFGNASMPFALEFMRRGYPRDLVDAFGDEDLGQLLMPEAPPSAYKSLYWLKEYTKLYKYDVPITSCYEWRCRPTTPGCLTGKQQAELYARDCLQALTFRLPHINAGLLHDTGDSYYYSRWGGTGLCHRHPLLTPKPSYVAIATLTRELDGARFVRVVPSPLLSLHIAEFRRGDALVYALWLPRGERQVALTFDQTTAYAHVDMMGNATKGAKPSREARLHVSSSPSYLHVTARIAKAAGGPTTCEPPPARCTVVDDLCDAARWVVGTARDEYLEKTHFDFPRRPGKFTVGVVDDAQKGRALEVKLLPQPDVPWPCPRYLVLEAKNAKPVDGRPTAVGMWVKGNSCWGRVMWEFEDAKGERFFSIGAPCGGWLVGDWRTRSYINFDGWNYLSVRLLTWYSSGFHGPERRNWKYDGGDGHVDFPIRFRRLVIEMRDRVVRLTDAVPVPNRAIRLRDLSVSFD